MVVVIGSLAFAAILGNITGAMADLAGSAAPSGATAADFIV